MNNSTRKQSAYEASSARVKVLRENYRSTRRNLRKKSDKLSCRVLSRGIFTYVGVCIALTAPVTSREFETITCWTAKLPWTTNDHIDNSLFAVQWCASRDQREVITRVMRDIGIHGKFLWKWLVHIVWLAQLAECRTTVREIGGSNLGRANTQGLQITEYKVLPM